MSQSQRQHPRKWSQARDHLFSPGNQPNLREELPRNSDGVGVAAAEVHRALPPPPAPAPALSKKGTPWTEEEHLLFLEGLHKFGKGDWKSIARYCVVSRTPSQIASHAQKYFLRHNPISEKRRKRKSIHDITLREPIHVREPIHNIPIGQPIHDIPIAIGEPIHGIPIGHDIPIGEPIHSIPIMEPIHDINLGEGLVPPFLDHHYLFPNLQNWELYTPNWLLPQDIAMQQQLQELQQAQELFNSNPPNYLPLQGYGFGKFNNCL